MKRVIAVLGLFSVWVGAEVGAAEVALEEPFELARGGSATFSELSVSVEFLGITEDSRCTLTEYRTCPGDVPSAVSFAL